MDDKKVLKNIGAFTTLKLMGMLLSFVYTPLALAYLGDTDYGIWTIVLNVISWINYFDIGIGNGLKNKLTEALSFSDYDSSHKYVSTAYAGTSLISFIFCTIIILVWKIFDLSSFFNLISDEDVDLVICLSVIFVCVNFVFSLSKTSAYAIQKPSIIGAVDVACQLVQIIFLYIFIKYFNSSLLLLSLMYGVFALLNSLIVYKVVTHNRSYLVPKIKFVKIKYLAPLLTLGIGFFAMQMCSLVLNTGDNLLISNLYGSDAVTPYSIVYKTFYLFVQFHAILVMPLWPAYTEASAKNDIKWIRLSVKRSNFITLLLCVFVVPGVLLFKPFSIIWLHKDLMIDASLIVFVALYMISQMFANNFSVFLCGVGYIKISIFLSVFGAVVNIPLSYYLAEYCNYKINGIIIGSLAVMLLSVITLPFVYYSWIRKREMKEVY